MSDVRRPPWLSLFAPPTAWFAYQQGLGAVVGLACVSSPAIGVVSGLAALGICVAAGVAGARAAVGAGTQPPPRAFRFIGLVGAGEAAVMALAILYQLLATVIVPPCAR